ncbi:capsid protein [Sphingomonas zeae]
MAQSPYPIDPHLTAIAIAYKNQSYIADIVLPRIEVGKQAFTFMQYGMDTFFNTPDTLIGRRSQANQVTMEGVEITDATEDHGLEAPVPQADVDNADERYDPLGNAAALTSELIEIRREIRAAAIIFNPATYDPALRTTLATTDVLDNPNTDAVSLISDALDKPLMRPNQMTFGQRGWTKFRRNAGVIKAIRGTNGGGVVSKEEVAALFEVNEVVVGQAFGNQARKGQAAQMSRLWGNHLALTYKAPVMSRETPTFAGTFTWGDRIASQRELKPGEMGLRGGTAVLVGESVKERVIAAQAGYFFENAFSPN